jgi:hypothetical protein
LTSPIARGLVASIWPNRVHYYYGLHDFFHCSPPRLAATQLCRILVFNGFNYVGNHTQRVCATRERTHAKRRLGICFAISASLRLPVAAELQDAGQ